MPSHSSASIRQPPPCPSSANDNFLKTMGYALEEIVGQHHRIFCTPDHAASAAYESFWKALGRGEYEAGVYKRLSKSGQDVRLQATYNPVFDVDGNLLKVVKFASDITQGKIRQAEAEARSTAIDRSQAVIEFTLDGIILDANANFLAAVGYDRADIIGQHHRIFCDPLHAQSADYAAFWTKLGRRL